MFPLNPTPQDIFQARIFENPLVPVGPDPTPDESAALTAALLGYANRSCPDDFSSLTGFLDAYPTSSWSASLLTNLGLEYYNTGHYSKTMDVWRRAWELAHKATDVKGRAVANRAVGELAYMYGRLGRMTELEALLESVQDRIFSGRATEMICGARQGLWNMQTHPEISFRCGPLALYRIKLSVDPQNPGTELIQASESTREGFSLFELAELSSPLGLHFQMAFREKGAEFVVPSVVHLRVDHFAAIIRKEGDSYLLQDPTFGNDKWITKEALETEASGYFLVPHGELASGWRTVHLQEGGIVRGKGNVGPGPPPPGPCDPHTNPCDKPCKGMAVPRVHLLAVSLNINDEPVGYSPPLGPAVRFTVRYNQRDSVQPDPFPYSNFGPKWTFDWLSYLTDAPFDPNSDVFYYIMGGGTRTFTGFTGGSQTSEFQQFDQTRLTRTSPASYEMLSPDGARKIFSHSDGATGTSRKIFLTELIDRFGNSVTLTYDANLRITKITDAIKQDTTISYENPADSHKITKVTDPFGRFATFAYDDFNRLKTITDVSGMTSEFTYEGRFSDFITTLKTPYGVTSFTKSEAPDRRSLETVYPDGNKDRVEFRNQDLVGNPTGIPAAHHAGVDAIDFDPASSVPTGMATSNEFLQYRNTYYWSRIAYAEAPGDYTKAKIYHWLHTTDLAHAEGILESVKEPLEGRVWYDYAGQPEGLRGSIVAGKTNKPSHIGRVLDDGSSQLYSYEYNDFGNVTKMIDPVGRTFSFIYDADGIDLLETRQTRVGQNELLSQITYNDQHLPLTAKDAAGQVTTYTYNAEGQVATKTNARNETTTYNYNANGYLTSIDGPLGAGDTTTFTYDVIGRVKTKTDVSGYTLTFEYDNLDHLIKITFPDGTFDQFTYTLLDHTLVQDRAGRQTSFEYNSVRQMTRRTDPLNRATLFQWCKCGDLKGITDPMGRTTTWGHDVQGRVTHKQYVNGSRVTYRYEQTTGRPSQRIDEKFQVTQYHYHRDDTLSRQSYSNSFIPTPPVAFAYDANYNRLSSMTDITGTTRYSYIPISPTLMKGAGQLASVDGPQTDDIITYSYDELGRVVARGINGVTSSVVFDANSRVTSETNALGTFIHTYDGATRQRLSTSYPNGQTTTFSYLNNRRDRRLERITHTHGATPISEFSYGYDALFADRIGTWSQKSGTRDPILYTLAYDAADQLTNASETQSGSVMKLLAYTYDLAGNRSFEQINDTTSRYSYNALNELISAEGAGGVDVVYHWDAENRLADVVAGNQITQFTYDGLGRRVGIRQMANGAEVSNRLFVWCDNEICEVRTGGGRVLKRFFVQGMKVEEGPVKGNYYYTQDHLGSVRELTDSSGNVRARYSYEPFGRRTRLKGDLDGDPVDGDLDVDFGFAGMFWANELGLNLTKFRAYDPGIGRWLSKDPLKNAEVEEGINLFAYVQNNPVNLIDPLGLCCDDEKRAVFYDENALKRLLEIVKERLKEYAKAAAVACGIGLALGPAGFAACLAAAFAFQIAVINAKGEVENAIETVGKAESDLRRCLAKPCPSSCKP
jgi:RHS repeat-associated protein